MIRARAPGKLVLLGEYAVLDGAPGLVAAVDRFASVTLTAAAERSFAGATGQALLDAVLAEVWLPGTPPAHLALDTSAFQSSGGQKLGLGSSAALTVALVRAVREHRGEPHDDEAVFASSLRAHLAFQRGAGSGIDVAASVHGGVIRFQRVRGGLPARTRLAWPKDLTLVAVWSGRPSDTREHLATMSAYAGRDPASYAAHMRHLRQVTEEGCAAFMLGDPPTVLAAVGAYADGLQRLGADSGVPIFTPEHEQVRGVADAVGARYKPAGAGGGDLGVALCPDPEVAAALRARLSAPELATRGIEVIDLHVVQHSPPPRS